MSPSPRYDERRRAEEELIDPVIRAVGTKRGGVEDLPHRKSHSRDHHPVPGLVCFRSLIRSHLDAPRIGADRCNLPLMTPIAVLELHARRVAAGVPAPLPNLAAALHLTGTDDHEVAPTDLHVLGARGRIQLVI